jgi:hypothetical protein
MKTLSKSLQDYGKHVDHTVATYSNRAKQSLQQTMEMAPSNDEDDEDDHENDDFNLEEDIFSLWFVSECKSICFVYCLFVFFVQVMILILMWSDMVKDDDRTSFEQDDNRWNIPVAVDTNVAMAQFLALIIVVVSQEDVLGSLDALISARYNRQVVVDNVGIPHASLFRWRFFNILRWIEGMMTLLLSLLIVIQVSKKTSTRDMDGGPISRFQQLFSAVPNCRN